MVTSLDDIIIWSDSVEEHCTNIATILSALHSHHLYCSPKKMQLFCTELTFLGHHISCTGIEVDSSKVNTILAWPTLCSASNVRSFLGLVRYISSFLPSLATHTLTLAPLTMRDAEKNFTWDDTHQAAFEAIKHVVVSRECLTIIDHANMGSNCVFVLTDVSDFATGAVLSYGETLESAQPVMFDSMQLKGAELIHPMHEKELLAIVHALRHWRTDLLGVPFISKTANSVMRAKPLRHANHRALPHNSFIVEAHH